MRKRFFTIPNCLTLFRVVSAPLFVVFWFAFGGKGLPEAEQEVRRLIGLWACLAIVVLSEVSDLLDGFLARRWRQVSTFGKLMDPYADSIFRLTAMLCFASGPHGPWYPLWMPISLVWRDIGTSIIRTFGMEQGIAVAASFLGKAKAAAQGALVIALLILAVARTRLAVLTDPRFRNSATIMMTIVVVIAWLGLANYIRVHISLFRRAAAATEDGTPDDKAPGDRSPDDA